MTAPKPTRLICPLIAGDASAMRADMDAAAAAGADMVECRLDYLLTRSRRRDCESSWPTRPWT